MSIRWLLIASGLVYGISAAMFQAQCANSWSRTATAQAIVEQRTFAIDQISTTPRNIDKVWVGRHFYSDKPPMLAMLASVVYFPLYHMGIRLAEGRNFSYWVLTFSLIGGSSILCLAAFYSSLQLVGLAEKSRLLMTSGLAFATLLFPWSATFNNHSFSGAWIFISFYFCLKARLDAAVSVRRSLALAGAAIGLAASVDTAATLFVIGFGSYSIYWRKLRPGAWCYLLAALAVLLPGTLVSHSITGDFRPITVHREYFDYPGSYWMTGVEELSGMRRNSLPFTFHYALNLLLGRNGFFIYNPLLIIAIAYAVWMMVRRRELWIESLFAIGLCATFAGYFFLYTSNYGGACYGVRWFVALIPLIWFFAYPYFRSWTVVRSRVYLSLFVISFLIAIVGVTNQWPRGNNHHSDFLVNVQFEVIPRLARITGSRAIAGWSLGY